MMDKKALALVFEQLAREHPFSGTILVDQAGEILFERAYGFASRQLGVPNALDTKFHVASLTKMFTAMAALILTERGQISLREKPTTYLPELAALDQDITLHHLLSHTSGLADIYDVPHLRFEMSKLKHDHGDLLSYLVHLPQLFRPGQGWRYSSTGYILLGYLMERVTGLSFSELMQQLVLAPLSMTNTGLDLPRHINPGRAYGHTVEDGQVVNAANDKLSVFEEAPGELYSTVHDVKTWCDALFECPLVTPPTLQLMFTPYAQVDSLLQYGYGWFLAPNFRMHGGHTPGFLSRLRQYPEQQVSVILLFNSDQMDLETIFTAVNPLVQG